MPLNIRVMLDACRKAERFITKDFLGSDQIHSFEKPGEGVYTETDLKVESVLRAELSKSKPGCGFIGEECGEVAACDSDLCFIIDPIDGTVNFIRRVPFFAISVALAKDCGGGAREVIAGLIYAPILREIYWATKGHGAYMEICNMRVSRMRVAEKKSFDNSLVLFMPTCLKKSANLGGFMEKCWERKMSARALGSASLSMAYVAAGKADAFFGGKLRMWDVAAGLLVNKEAGAIVTSRDGRPLHLTEPDVVCANSHLHSKCISIVDDSEGG